MKNKSKIFSIILFLILAFFMNAAECRADNDKGIKAKTTVEKKKESQNVLVKFLISMLWVAGSCGAIFLILLAYKKLKQGSVVDIQNTDIAKNLNSPDTIEEAAKFFIEKF